MSASRSPWCSPTTPISPRTPPSWSRSRSRSCRRSSTPPRRPASSRRASTERRRRSSQRLRRSRRRLRRGARGRRARARDRPAQRRAARDARRDRRATTPRRASLELYGAAKVPHYNRDALAAMLGLPPSGMHLHEGHVGGGFGIRGELYPEDVLVCLAALRLGRPVKWIEDRREHLMAANHSREQLHQSAPRSTRDGLILASTTSSGSTRAPMSAPTAPRSPDLTAAMLPGPYVIPAYRVGRPCPADQQDAGRHLSRARPLRGHLRARAADRRDRRPARARPGRRCAGINLITARARCRSRRPSTRSAPRSSTTPATTRACSTSAARARAATTSCKRRCAAPARSRRAGRAAASALCREERARPVRRRAHRVDARRRGRGGDRRRLGRPGLRDRDGPDLRRRARATTARGCGSSTARPTASPTASARSPRAPR